MICLQFDRMLTLRNIVVLLFLEASFSLAIANNQERRARKQKTTPDQGGCNIIQVDNTITQEVSLTAKGKIKVTRIPKNKLQLSQGGSIQYSCLRKHHVYGVDTLMCKANGEWSQPPPVCVAPLCSPIQTPDDDGPLKMEAVVPHNGAVLRFSCSSGFILRGGSTIYCSRKRWNDHPPECTGTPSNTTYRQPTHDSTAPVESVKTTTSGSPTVDESPTTSPDDTDELPSVATVEKAKTSEAFRVITITVATRTPPLPMSTRVASSTVESQVPEYTTPEAELLQSVDVGDHRSHPTIKTEESTAPSSAPAFSSFPDDVMESDTTASNNLDRITRSSSDELTEAQSTSSFEMFNQDEETEGPDRRVTDTHQLFPDEELEEKVSTGDDAYETTSQKPFETEDSVVTSAEMMVSESEEQDDTTPETRDLSSASGIGLKKIEDDDVELQSPTLESVSHYTVSQELLTVQSNSFRIQVPINEAETRRTPEENLSSFTVDSEDINLPLGPDFTEIDSKSQRSLIVTHFSTKTPTESSSEDETVVMRPEEIPTNENKTGKTRSRSQSVLTTHVPPLNPSGYRSTPVTAPTIDSAAMTRGNSASIVLIVIIVAAVIVLVVLLSILGKALLPKCTLLQKPCSEQGAVPYTAQSNQPDQVVLKGINPMPENDSCTQV